MPYISPEQRQVLDEAIDQLIHQLLALTAEYHVDALDGALNYSITRLLKGLYRASYTELNAALGVLESVKLEYYRRVVTPYEDRKRNENGDV